jgi:hypothetical protein
MKFKEQSAPFQSISRPDPSADPGKEFIFRLRNGREVAKSKTFSDFISKIRSVPLESLEYHFKGRHFSPWLRYLKLNAAADEIEKISSSGEKLRQDLVFTLSRFR